MAGISREVGCDVKTVRKYISRNDFSPRPPRSHGRASILDPYKTKIETWLQEDKGRWPKQRHSSQRIYDRLRAEEGYKGSYPTVQRYVKRWREEHRQVDSFQDLVWYPGQAQVDLGEANFIENGHRRRKHYLVMTFPYSNYGLVQLVQDESAVSICTALQDIFSYLDHVPHRLVFDNATGVGRKRKGGQVETELFARFRAHYGFELKFCNPHAGHEKGNVENKVGFFRRNLFVPERSYVDLQAFNRTLLAECRFHLHQEHYLKGERIEVLLQEDLDAMSSFSPVPFDVCEYKTYVADGYGRVLIDGHHRYGSRPEYARRTLLVRIRAFEITVFDPKQNEVASYPRSFGPRKTVNTLPQTTLKHLSRHPGAWENSPLRESLSAELRQQMDELESDTRRSLLKTFSELTERYNYKLAQAALEIGLSHNDYDVDHVAVMAARLFDGGLGMPVSQGPDLTVYDEVFRGEFK